MGGGASWLEKYLCKENEAQRSLISRCTTSILQCCIRRRNGMELPMTIAIMLVVLLALLAIMLVLISHGGNDFADLGG